MASKGITIAGAHPGIFEGRNPIHEKAHQNFLEEETACEYCFSDLLVEKIFGVTTFPSKGIPISQKGLARLYRRIPAIDVARIGSRSTTL